MVVFDFIDRKNNCSSVIVEGMISNNFDPDLFSGPNITWTFNKNLKNKKNVEFIYLFTDGKDLRSFCPSQMIDQFDQLVKKHKNYLQVFKKVKMNLKDVCFYDLVPISFIEDYFGLKCEIMCSIYQTVPKPKNYDEYLRGMLEIIDDIHYRKIKLNFEQIFDQTSTARGKAMYHRLKQIRPFVEFNLFGSKTGRLTTKKGSFPILNLDKKLRKIVQPTNNLLVEFDFNSAELRTFLGLCGNEQPDEDIHLCHQKEFNKIYSNEPITRDEAKKKVLAWLYNGHKGNGLGIPKIEQMYNKKKLISTFWNGEFIETPYGKRIPSDEFHAISFTVQTTNAEMFYKQLIKVYSLLEGKKSFIKWLIHDSFVLDLSIDEVSLLKPIAETFGNTDFGKYLVNLKIGKNFGEMKKVKL